MNAIEQIEQLKEELSRTTNKQKQAGLLLDILGKYEDIQSTAGESLLPQLAAICAELNDQTITARYHFLKSCVRGNKNEFAEALDELDIAIQLYTDLELKQQLAECYNSSGALYMRQNLNVEALASYLKALKLAEEIGDERMIGLASFNMGIISHAQGNSDEALARFEKGRLVAEKLGLKSMLISCFQNIGAVYVAKNMLNEGRESYLKGLDIAISVGNYWLASSIYSNLGLIYVQQNDYDTALQHYQKAIDLFTKTGDEQELLAPLINMGELYWLKKQNDVARSYLNRVITIAEKINAQGELREALRIMYLLNKEEGDAGSALSFYERYVAVNDELMSTENSRKIASLQFEYHIEQKENEVRLEREKKEELQKAYNLLDTEKQRSENLLLNILPAEVAEELKQHGKTNARLFDNVTVLFTDFKGFTTVSEKLSPQQLVNELHACFSGFDMILEKHGIEKIKTVGDAYLAICGLPVATPHHAVNMVQAAIEIRNFMLHRKKHHPDTFEIRIGLHSGSVVAGIVGIKKFAYDIWGDTVNTAARMEQNGQAGKINISQQTYELVKHRFSCEYRGEIEAKNKGLQKMYFVE